MAFPKFCVLIGLLLSPTCLPAQTPQALAPPEGETLLFQAHGKGDQIYTCKKGETGYAWILKAPDARLLNANGDIVGRHFAGPTWEASDGSRVMGKVSANSPSPDPASIPWLLLSATGHQGEGKMSPVSSVQRLKTKAGKAPRSGCDEWASGKEVRVPYEAEYYFYGKGSPVSK